MKLSILVGTKRNGESVVIGKPGKSAEITKQFKAIKDGIVGTAKSKIELARLDMYGVSQSDSLKTRRFKA